MPDPLSSLAAVINILEAASRSINALVSFCRQFRDAPAEVHEWLTMLEALRSTLSTLGLYSCNLDPRYRFSLHFQRRLLSCVNQLQACSSEFGKVDKELIAPESNGNKKWDHRSMKAWARIKWVVVGSHKKRKVMKLMSLYHFEFAMELSKVMM